MRIVTLGVLIATLLLPPHAARSQEGTPPTTVAPGAEGPPEQTTTVRGTPPADLVGRWLVVGRVILPSKDVRNATTLWTITKENGQLALIERFADFPAAVQSDLDAANSRNEAWLPTPEQVSAIATAWDSLRDRDTHLAEIKTEIFGPDDFDASFKNDPNSKNSLWAIRQTENFRPSGAPSIRQVNFYSANAPHEGGWIGYYTTATIAAAPFPIPIALTGSFQTYRLEAGATPAPRGFIARLLDVFRGCGRR